MTTVLVVDDSAVDRRLVGGLLGKMSDCTIVYAGDGVEALAQAEKELPDLIVTDLRMPNMDGLELVRAIRAKHPVVPVILITAHGSEVLAVEALKQGAAGYVPKTQIGENLLDTVEEVLAMAKADQNYEKMINCLNKSEFTFFLELQNDPALIDPLLELVKQSVARIRLCDFTGQLRIGVALKEALLNAILRGNLEIGFEEAREAEANGIDLVQERRNQEPYRDRRVFIDVKVSTVEARFVVRDEGPGFDVTALPDPTESTSGHRKGGRGLSLMLTFMDEVTFNDVGNEVTLIKLSEDDESMYGTDTDRKGQSS